MQKTDEEIDQFDDVDVPEGVDITDDEDEIPNDVQSKIVEYQKKAGQKVDIYATIDGINVYISKLNVEGGKVSYDWFTYTKLTDNQKEALQNSIDAMVTKLITKESDNKWSLQKQFSRIYSIIANTLARFFRT